MCFHTEPKVSFPSKAPSLLSFRTCTSSSGRSARFADPRPAVARRRLSRTEGPKDRRTEGPKDRRTEGPKDRRTEGPKDRKRRKRKRRKRKRRLSLDQMDGHRVKIRTWHERALPQNIQRITRAAEPILCIGGSPFAFPGSDRGKGGKLAPVASPLFSRSEQPCLKERQEKARRNGQTEKQLESQQTKHSAGSLK